MGNVVKPEAINHPLTSHFCGGDFTSSQIYRGIAIVNILWGWFLIGFSTIQSLRTYLGVGKIETCVKEAVHSILCCGLRFEKPATVSAIQNF